MILYGGRKPEYLERTHTYKGELANLILDLTEENYQSAPEGERNFHDGDVKFLIFLLQTVVKAICRIKNIYTYLLAKNNP